MTRMKEIICNCNPFHRVDTNKPVEKIIQNVLLFVVIYAAAALLMEGVIITFFSIQGYDMLHGDMPDAFWVSYLPLYGFLGFFIITLIFGKIFQKMSAKDMMFSISGKECIRFLAGFLAGIFLILVTIGLVILGGGYQFKGIGSPQMDIVIMGLFAYLFQSCAEEMMCRGFLQNALSKKCGYPVAIAVSAVAFIWPHLSGVLSMPGILLLAAMINLVLISVLFSLVMIRYQSLLASCGLHAGWNFFLSVMCGLQLTGRDAAEGLFVFFVTAGKDWVTGGSYGIEASILLIPVLAVANVLMYVSIKRKQGGGNGIQ